MSRGPSSPSKASAAGIVDDPINKSGRIIPESRRADGSIRKERRVKAGFVPVEDIARFRPSRVLQAHADAQARRTDGTPDSAAKSKQSTAASNSSSQTNSKAPVTTYTARTEQNITPDPGAKLVSSTTHNDAGRPPVKKATEVPDAWDDEEGDDEGDNTDAGKVETKHPHSVSDAAEQETNVALSQGKAPKAQASVDDLADTIQTISLSTTDKSDKSKE